MKNSKANNILFISVFLIFILFNLFFIGKGFFGKFLNINCNADEYYHNNLYDISNFSLEQFSKTPSQVYVLMSSIINSLIDKPVMATRWVSLVVFFVLLFYIFKKIDKIATGYENIIGKLFLSFVILITQQCFIGTSDFMAQAIFVYFYIELIEGLETKQIGKLKIVFLGFFLGICVANRPTTVVLLLSLIISLLLFKSSLIFENIFKWLSMGLITVMTIGLVNIYPIIKENKIVLDIKEVPIEKGTSWLERNYLMAKLWDNGTLPKGQWLSSQDVLNFKKNNPKEFIPKSNLDFVFNEPKLFMKQMIRMFVSGNYTSFRFMYLFFPLLLIVFIKNKINKWFLFPESDCEFKYKVIVSHLFISILLFSFLAIKLFEARWIIPIFIIYWLYSFEYLKGFNKNFRMNFYFFSAMFGILFYLKGYIFGIN